MFKPSLAHTAAPADVAMPLCIRYDAVVSMGGKQEWRIKGCNIWRIGDQDFVKIAPYDQAFIRMVAEGVVENIPRNASLSQCAGLRELVQLRNNAQQNELHEDRPACSLFGDPEDDAGPQKRVKRTAAELRDNRLNPDVLSVSLPRLHDADNGPASMLCVRPSHPCDDLTVQLTSDVLEHIVARLRSKGITEDVLASKRRYSQENPGVWSSGSGTGYVVKFRSDESGAKYKRFRNIMDALRAKQAEASGPPALTAGEDKPIAAGEGVVADENAECNAVQLASPEVSTPPSECQASCDEAEDID